MMACPLRLSVLKMTQDDWAGSYRIKGYYHGQKNQMFVEVRLSDIEGNHENWVVGVWGNDDHGLVKEFYGQGALENAKALFDTLVCQKYVDIVTSQELGLVWS